MPISDEELQRMMKSIDDLDRRVHDLEREEFAQPGAPGIAGGGGWSLIETQTKTVAERDFDFASIPQTFRHLMLVTNTRADTGILDATSFGLQFNSDFTAGNYNAKLWFSGDPILFSTSDAVAVMVMHPLDAALPADNWGMGLIFIGNYVDSVKNKAALGFGTIVTGTDAFDRNMSYSGGQWEGSNADDPITDIRVRPTPAGIDKFKIGSRVDLFGFGTA